METNTFALCNVLGFGYSFLMFGMCLRFLIAPRNATNRQAKLIFPKQYISLWWRIYAAIWILSICLQDRITITKPWELNPIPYKHKTHLRLHIRLTICWSHNSEQANRSTILLPAKETLIKKYNRMIQNLSTENQIKTLTMWHQFSPRLIRSIRTVTVRVTDATHAVRVILFLPHMTLMIYVCHSCGGHLILPNTCSPQCLRPIQDFLYLWSCSLLSPTRFLVSMPCGSFLSLKAHGRMLEFSRRSQKINVFFRQGHCPRGLHISFLNINNKEP